MQSSAFSESFQTGIFEQSVFEGIQKILEPFSNPLEIPTSKEEKAASLLRKRNCVLQAVQNQRPIQMVILGFPAKSPNRVKTLSPLPDRAEVEGLKILQSLCDEIAKIYAPGASLILCSDGRVFADQVSVSDHHITTYQKHIEEIISYFQLRSLSHFGLEKVYPSLPPAKMRDKLLQEFGHTQEETRQKVPTDAVQLAMFNGIHRFLFEDFTALHPELSRNRCRNLTKELAYETIRRSQAFSDLVQEKFPNALRLSIHPQPKDSWKIGISLGKSQNRWVTPWHSVLCQTQNGPLLIKHKEALELGATLELFEGRWPYFDLKGIA